MNHQCHLKTIINFKYQIQHTNQIYQHSFNSFTSSIQHTLTPDQHTYNIGLHHPYLSQSIRWHSSREQIENQQRNEMNKLTSTQLKYEKTLLIQQQGRTVQLLDQTGPKIQNQFSKPRKNKSKQSKLILSSTPQKKQLLETSQSKSNFNRKGLALISSLIQEVLQTIYTNSKRFTCAQISSYVLDEFCRKAQTENNRGQIDEKQRKTIKRRVYDSINVLIALDKIKKDHKWLYVQQVGKRVGQEIVAAKKQKVSNLSRNIAHKQQLLSIGKRQYQRLRQLKQRNQGISYSKQITEVTLSTQRGHTAYRFPLIMVSTDKQNKLSVELQTKQGNKKQVAISAQHLHVISELTALDLINIQNERNLNNLGSFE